MRTRIVQAILRLVSRRYILIILLELIIALIAVFLYTYNRFASFYDVDFWQNAVSNFIATFLGLLLGIPVVLWMNNLQQRIIDDNEKLKSNEEARQRRKIILTALRKELNGAYDLLKDYPGYTITNESFDWLYFIALAPCLEVWRSFSDGGELKWIDDVDLLTNLAWAYYAIEQVKESGQLFIDAAYIHPRRGGKVIIKHLHEHFERNISEAVTFIKVALDKLDAQN